jgi:hypothetical protein
MFDSYVEDYLEYGFLYACDGLDTREEEFRNDETLYRLMLETAYAGETLDERLACLLWLASRDYQELVAEKGIGGYDPQKYSHGDLYDDIADAALALFGKMTANPEAFDKYRYGNEDINNVAGIGRGGKYEVTAVVAMNGDAARTEEMLSVLNADGRTEADYQELLQPFTDFLFYNPEHTRTLMPKLFEKGVDAGRMYSYLLGNYFADADANISLAHGFLTNYYGQSIGVWEDKGLYSLEFRIELEDIDISAYTPQGRQTGAKGKTALVVLHDGEFYETRLAWFAQSEERGQSIPLDFMPESLEETDMIIIVEKDFEKTTEYTDYGGSGMVFAYGHDCILDIYAYEYPSGAFIEKVGQVRTNAPGMVSGSESQGNYYAEPDMDGAVAYIAGYLKD